MIDYLSPGSFPANPLEKDGYSLEFHDEFDQGSLDTRNWLPYYLPHWSSRERSAPNYSFEDSSLALQITTGQQPWCPEFDGQVICSSIQTGQYSGPPGSVVGQHRFNSALIVREAQTNARLYTPQYGFFECRAKGVRSRANHVALWMIGYEDEPEKSGEVAMFEIFGKTIRPGSSRVGHGVRRWGDPALRDEFYEPEYPVDAANYHVYAMEWLPASIDFYIDNVKITTIQQSPNYPMQFMLSIYELPIENGGAGSPYPKTFSVDYVRAYQPIAGYQRS